jgi:hypothetical protein
MTDSTLDTKLFILYDLWPTRCFLDSGPRYFNQDPNHNVATAKYPVGAKVKVRNEGRSTSLIYGESTFIYLKLEMQDATNVLAAKMFVSQHSDAAGGGDSIWDATNEVASDLGATFGPIAMGISAMTTDYYGWFWCGGPCPEEYVLSGATYSLDGNCGTDGTVAIGKMAKADLASAGTTYGEIGLSLPAADTASTIGYAYAADA